MWMFALPVVIRQIAPTLLEDCIPVENFNLIGKLMCNFSIFVEELLMNNQSLIADAVIRAQCFAQRLRVSAKPRD